MADKSEIENLKKYLECTSDKLGVKSRELWYCDNDNVLTVALILDGERYFDRPRDVIYFFEKPWKWESEMKEIVDYTEAEADYAK